MTNATMTKFGYPGTVVAEFAHWAVLLRPKAVTMGSLILIGTSEAIAYSKLPSAAFAEQAQVVRCIEAALAGFVAYEKINYLMLMLVDPHVHFHVIPRYGGARRFRDRVYPDGGWPGLPDLETAPLLDPDISEAMIQELRNCGLQ